MKRLITHLMSQLVAVETNKDNIVGPVTLNNMQPYKTMSVIGRIMIF